VKMIINFVNILADGDMRVWLHNKFRHWTCVEIHSWRFYGSISEFYCI